MPRLYPQPAPGTPQRRSRLGPRRAGPFGEAASAGDALLTWQDALEEYGNQQGFDVTVK